MKKIKFHIDLLQILFSFSFITIMVIAFIWIIKPFILSFTWASIIVITTWPIIIKLEGLFWGKRLVAVIFMITILVLLFVIPIAFLVDNLIDNSINFLHWIFKNNMHIPKLYWLDTIPIIGNKIYINYQKFISNGGFNLISKIQPYIGRTTGFFFTQASYFGRFMIHLFLMLLFSILLYCNGEQITKVIYLFADRVSGSRGKTTILLTVQVIRSVVLGIVVTAIVQGILSGIGLIIFGIPYASIVVFLVISLCLLQIGPLPVLIPAVIWLYWNENSIFGSALLIWSIFVVVIDNILKLILIRMGADLPFFIILSGTIGGFLAIGMIGLFIGPVILSVSYRLIFAWIHDMLPQNTFSIKLSEKKIN